MKKIFLLALFLWTSTFAFAQKFYTVDQIPNPKTNGQDYFVSNPYGILSNVTSIDEKLFQLEKETKVEFAIVFVKNFEEDQEDFEFAKAIFDKWGIGKARSDNGLLLFIAQNRRKYRFISGNGVEGLLPDIVARRHRHCHRADRRTAHDRRDDADEAVMAASTPSARAPRAHPIRRPPAEALAGYPRRPTPKGD